MSQGAPVPPALVPPRVPPAMMHYNEARRAKMPRWLAVGLWSFFTAAWIALAILLIVSPETVEELWTWIGEQPTLLQIAMWVAFLPLMVAVAVWETSWALWIRLGVLALCVIWTTIGFYPNRIARKS